MQVEKQIPKIIGRAMTSPETWDDESNSIVVTFATDTPVFRSGWDTDYNEVLSMDVSHIRLDRINGGAPVLDSHSTYDLENQLGVVEEAYLEDGVLRAKLKLSTRESIKDIVSDIKNGIIRNISVGYRVYRFEQLEGGEETIPTYLATDWEPCEISFVTVPADHNSGVRSETKENENLVIIQTRGTDTPTANLEIKTTKNAMEGDNNNPVVDTAEVTRQAVKAEKTRQAEINNLVRMHKLGEEFASKFIENDNTIDEVRAAVLDELAKATPETRSENTKLGTDRGVEHKKRAIEAALLRKSGSPEVLKEYTEDEQKAANAMGTRSMLQLGTECLEMRGVDTKNMSKSQIATRAITQTSSDFPVLLENVLNKTLLSNYELAADTWRRFCGVGNLTDFRAHKLYKLGQFGALEEVVEGAEYQYDAIPDGESESITAKTYGKLINLSRQAMINDDLSALIRTAQSIGMSAALTIEEAVYALLGLNSGLGPTMSDGDTLFHANHSNVGTGLAISVAALEAERVLMATQKDPNNKRFLNLRPSSLVLPIGLEGSANVINSSQYDNDGTKFQKPNIVNGLYSDIVGTPYLTGTRRYSFANASIAPAIMVGFLDGMQTPYLEMEDSFNQDGTNWKCRLDFGVAAVDYRGATTDAGA